ncbi:YggT family protein, partial [Erwinia amylovora]|uniref:YggT family protein n=1 Tax=Erwinia amylovora TaxID=552 RepID=UPI003B75C9FB
MAIYIKVLLLRIWMQRARCDFYNPFSQFVVNITQPIVKPLRRIIPSIGPLDTASLLIAFIVSVLSVPVMLRLFIPDQIFLYLGLVLLVKAAGVLVFWVII